MELKSFVLELFHKANINSRYSLPTPSGDNNRELVKTLFDQIEYLQKEWTHRYTNISCSLENGKPLSVIDQKSSDNSNSDKIIENSSQNRNEDSNAAYGIDFTSNKVNDVSHCTKNKVFH